MRPKAYLVMYEETWHVGVRSVWAVFTEREWAEEYIAHRVATDPTLAHSLSIDERDLDPMEDA